MAELARITGPNFNADLTALVTIHADQLPWRSANPSGVEEKLFERIGEGSCARETSLVRLKQGLSIAPQRAECRVDIYVLEGSLDLAGRSCRAGHFVRILPGGDIGLRANTSATVLLKKRGGPAAGDPVFLDIKDRSNWAPWGGRGSEKAQIYEPSELQEASWVGYMLPNLTIPEHSHAGGEEIFILEGDLRDERGLYGPGAWVRFPVGVTHTPTSLDQGCLMLVREGDALPPH